MIREALEQTGVAGLLGWREDQDDGDSIINRALAAALYPFQLAVSPTAIKAYLTIFLFLTTSFILLSISTTAFGVFYYNYIPQTDFERPIYLQYASGKHPNAEILLNTNALISQQPYDVSIVLHMPRDPTNLKAGNFMLDLILYGSKDNLAATVLETLNLEDQVPDSALHRSRRPALMPYASTTTDLVSKLIHLPLHVLSWHDSDSITMTIPMFEQVEFARGRDNIPRSAVLQLQTQKPPTNEQEGLHVYSAKLVFQVRFQGLRYVIYHYRILAFAVFTALFYGVSITTLVVGWALIATMLRSGKIDEPATMEAESTPMIKQEPETDVSLRTTSDNKIIKTEDADESEHGKESERGRSTQITPQTSEPASAASQEQSAPVEVAGGAPEEHADDEEEESEDEWEQMQKIRKRMEQDARQRQLAMQQHDSGIGTSLESENAAAARAGLVRRSSSSRKSER